MKFKYQNPHYTEVAIEVTFLVIGDGREVVCHRGWEGGGMAAMRSRPLGILSAHLSPAYNISVITIY